MRDDREKPRAPAGARQHSLQSAVARANLPAQHRDRAGEYTAAPAGGVECGPAATNGRWAMSGHAGRFGGWAGFGVIVLPTAQPLHAPTAQHFSIGPEGAV